MSRAANAMLNDLAGVTRGEHEALAAVLDNLALGVVVVTDGNLILHANRSALAMFARGRPIRSTNGRLLARDPAANAQLSDAIALVHRHDSTMGAGGIGVALGSAFGDRSIAHVLPLDRGDLGTGKGEQPAAAVFVIPAAPSPMGDLAPVARCFRLTPAEARIVERLVSGETLVEAAASLGIADTTAKTHLGHIFLKTGVARQVELIALILRIAPPVLVTAPEGARPGSRL